MAVPMVSGGVGIYAFLPNSTVAALRATATGLNFGGLGGAAGGLSLTTALASATALALSNLSRVPVLLGSSARGPRIKIRRGFSRVFVDITGPEIAYDLIDAGQEAMIFFDLSRWNERIYMTLAGMPNAGGPPGGRAPGAIGTLMTTEGKSTPFAFRFPAYDSHPVFRQNGGVAGYRFYSCVLDGEDDFETGSAANMRHLALRALPVFDARSNGVGLFDFDMSGIPALLPN